MLKLGITIQKSIFLSKLKPSSVQGRDIKQFVVGISNQKISQRKNYVIILEKIIFFIKI